jgi:hypothetical protein
MFGLREGVSRKPSFLIILKTLRAILYV